MATWGELVRLMGSTSVGTARGTWRGVEELAEADQDPQVHVQRFVCAPPDSWLVTTADGSPLRLCDGERVLLWRAADAPPTETDRRRVALQFRPDPMTLLRRSEDDDWSRSDDYSTPVGSPVPDVVAGRPCWRVDLSPPPHERGVLSLWIDEATGIRMRLSNSVHGLLEEIVELELDGPVDPGEFTYDGPVDRTEQDARDRDVAARHHFHDDPPPVPTTWPRGLGFRVHGGDVAAGSYVLDLEVNGAAQLARHPIGHPRWEPRGSRGTQVHRWADDTWQWTLAVDGEPLSAEEIEAVVASIPDERGTASTSGRRSTRPRP